MDKPSERAEVTAGNWPLLQRQGVVFVTNMSKTPEVTATRYALDLERQHGRANVLYGWPWNVTAGLPDEDFGSGKMVGVYLRTH